MIKNCFPQKREFIYIAKSLAHSYSLGILCSHCEKPKIKKDYIKPFEMIVVKESNKD